MISKEYSKALFDLALEGKKIDIIIDEFDFLCNAFDENKDIYKVFNTPNISKENKKSVGLKLFKDFNPLFQNFLDVLIDNNRFYLLKDIYINFLELVSDYNNVVNVVVYSTNKLNANQTNQINKNLEKVFINKKICISNYIDDSLLGGVKIIANGKSVDLSIKNELETMKSCL